MALVALAGTPLVPIGVGIYQTATSPPSSTSILMDAAAEATIFIGHVVTSDGGSHTINTTGSSSLGWRTGSATFSDVGTTVKVGLAAVDLTAGPPGRAANSSNVITFDVSKTLIGGGGGITQNVWQTHVPDAGTKTIANGDLVAFCVQMTARGGADAVNSAFVSGAGHTFPIVTSYVGGAYTTALCLPNCVITFSDGALGHLYTSDVFATQGIKVFNSGSSPNEYGQLFNLPFPLRIHGIYGWVGTSGDVDVVLYSAPLSGSPVAEKTISLDSNSVSSTTGRQAVVLFPTPYTYAAGNDIAVAFKPGASSVTVYNKTLPDAAYRIVEPFGTTGYGISRTSGAFVNANSSLEHYYIGLLVGAFEAGGAAGRTVQINSDSLVA